MTVPSDHSLAYVVMRVGGGLNMLMHGLVRIFDSGMGNFVSYLEKGFEGTVMPGFLLAPSAYLITGVELIGGLMLLIGLFTRWSAFVLGVLMIGLQFGMAMQQQWGTLADQFIYMVIFAGLVAFASKDVWNVDSLLNKPSA